MKKILSGIFGICGILYGTHSMGEVMCCPENKQCGDVCCPILGCNDEGNSCRQTCPSGFSLKSRSSPYNDGYYCCNGYTEAYITSNGSVQIVNSSAHCKDYCETVHDYCESCTENGGYHCGEDSSSEYCPLGEDSLGYGWCCKDGYEPTPTGCEYATTTKCGPAGKCEKCFYGWDGTTLVGGYNCDGNCSVSEKGICCLDGYIPAGTNYGSSAWCSPLNEYCGKAGRCEFCIGENSGYNCTGGTCDSTWDGYQSEDYAPRFCCNDGYIATEQGGCEPANQCGYGYRPGSEPGFCCSTEYIGWGIYPEGDSSLYPLPQFCGCPEINGTGMLYSLGQKSVDDPYSPDYACCGPSGETVVYNYPGDTVEPGFYPATCGCPGGYSLVQDKLGGFYRCCSGDVEYHLEYGEPLVSPYCTSAIASWANDYCGYCIDKIDNGYFKCVHPDRYGVSGTFGEPDSNRGGYGYCCDEGYTATLQGCKL